MTILEMLLLNGAAVMGMVTAVWIVSLIWRDASIVDRYWGMLFVLVAVVSAIAMPSPRSLLLLALCSIWGIRLSTYLTIRNWGEGEDYRYVAMREKHGARFPIVSLVTVFVLQGCLAWFVSLPMQVAAVYSDVTLGAFDYIGAAIWLTGFSFESVGDWQLRRFKADPGNKGKVMNQGLWRYTRHPNYFGDALLWWGFYVIAVGAPYGIATFLSPVVMTLLLVKISGAALLERSLKKTKPEYADYIARTSSFVPWPPKQV